LAHVMNNAMKNAADALDFDGTKLDKILSQLPRYFEKEMSRSDRVKRLMVALGTKESYTKKEKPVKAYCHTRWLSTGPATEALVMHFDSFYLHFSGEVDGKNVDDFKKFFLFKDTWNWLVILRSIASEFEEAILKIEGSDVTLLRCIQIFNDLRDQA